MPDFSYTPDLLSQLREQIRAAVATGLPWMVENAQRAYDFARASGANLPFDAQGNDVAGGAQLPPIPAEQRSAIDETAGAIRNADPAVFAAAAPPPMDDSPYNVDQLIASQGIGSVNNPPPADAAPPSLQEDPAYAAFVRALGNERASAERSTNEGVDAANRSLSLRLPQIADAGTRAREGLSGGYETRGLLRSGQHETALARQRQVEGDQTSALTDDTAQRVAALRSGLAERMAGFDSRQAEQNLAASGRLQASQDAQRLAATEQQSQAALLAEQRRANDLADARFRASVGQGGAPPAAPPNPGAGVTQQATAANPVGIVGLDPSDPDYITRLIAQMRGGA